MSVVMGRRVVWVLVAGAAAAGVGALGAKAAVEGAASTLAAAAKSPQGTLPTSADVRLHYVQEDGPESGHVRVELTPVTVPLTMMQARSAAQQAFLKALGEPGLGDDLKQIKVVVRLNPDQKLSPDGFEHTFVYLHKGGHDWAVLAPE